MKLGSKIAGGFAVVLILTAIVGYVGFSGLSGVVTIVDKADDGNRMIKQIQAARQQEKNFIIRGDQQYVEKVDEQVEEEEQTLKILEQLKMIGDSKNGLFMMDNALAQRAFNAPTDIQV